MELFVDLKVCRLRQEWFICDKLDKIHIIKEKNGFPLSLYLFGVSAQNTVSIVKSDKIQLTAMGFVSLTCFFEVSRPKTDRCSAFNDQVKQFRSLSTFHLNL